MFDAEGNFLIHGREWGQHKYIRKEGNRYIYPEDLKSGGGMPSNVGNQQRQNTSGSDYARQQRAKGSIAAEREKIKRGFESARQAYNVKKHNQQLQDTSSSAADYARRQKVAGQEKAIASSIQKAIDKSGMNKSAKRPNADITGQQAARRAANQGIASQNRINDAKKYQEGLKTSGKGIAEMESRRGKKNESRANSQRTTAARDAAKEAQRNRIKNTTSGSDYARRQQEAGEKNAKDIKRKIGYGTQAAKTKAKKAYEVGKSTTDRVLTRLKTKDIPNAKNTYDKATDAAAEGLLKATKAHKNLTDKASDALLDLEKRFKKKKK